MTTIEELLARIEAKIPCTDGILESHDADGREYLYMSSNGIGGPGGSIPKMSSQLFFTPEDAIKAFWWRFVHYIGDWGENNGFVPMRLNWREHLSLEEYVGAWVVIARFSITPSSRKCIVIGITAEDLRDAIEESKGTIQ